MATRQFAHRAFFRTDPLSDWLSDGVDEDGRGVGYTQAYHKVGIDRLPNRVACEYIASRLGQTLGLPIPPCAVTRFKNSDRPCFSSLDFNYERQSYAPILPDVVVEHMPLVCAGVLVFDIFIANGDRHEENIVVDRTDHPTRMQVFDFDQSLLLGLNLSGREKLKAITSDLGVTGTGPIGGNRHVFIDFVKETDDLDYWVARIERIPEFVIADACQFAVDEIGLEQSLGTALRDALQFRQKDIRNLIRDRADEFELLATAGKMFWSKP